VGRLAPWREWARLIEDPYLWPIAYSVTRMPKDPRFSTIELPKRDTSIVVTPEVRQNWVEGTILRWNGIISEGRPIDRELMQQAADLIVNDLSDEDMQLLLMQPRFVIRFGEIDEIAYYRYRGGYGGDTVGFSNDFIDWRWGSHTPAVLAAALLHEVGVHANQQLSRCTYRSIDGEHAAYYMQLALIWQLDEVYSGYYEDIRFASEGGYPTCWDNANE
jgi:hypothetical protein